MTLNDSINIQNPDEKRQQLIDEGFCVIPNALPSDFLKELRDQTNTLLDSTKRLDEWKYQGSNLAVKPSENPHIKKLLELKRVKEMMNVLGLDDFSFSTKDTFLENDGIFEGLATIISKDPHAPALYWHQDWQHWNDIMSITPWPQKIFLAYYLNDTTIENGCLKVIPGTHKKRIDLHDKLTPAHYEGALFVEEDDKIMFSDHPDQIDVPVSAGTLVIGDARVLHAARENQTDVRRNMILIWAQRPNTVPSYWKEELPHTIKNGIPDIESPRTRVPGKYLNHIESV